jgi:hypothetical protein
LGGAAVVCFEGAVQSFVAPVLFRMNSRRKQLRFKLKRRHNWMAKRCPRALGQILHIFVMLHSPAAMRQ